jgi:hypothetical protein
MLWDINEHKVWDVQEAIATHEEPFRALPARPEAPFRTGERANLYQKPPWPPSYPLAIFPNGKQVGRYTPTLLQMAAVRL